MNGPHPPDQRPGRGNGQALEPAQDAAAPLIEARFKRSFGDRLAAEELYYSATIYPLLDRVLAGLLLGLGVLAVHAAGLRWWALIWFPLSAAEALGVASAARLALGLLLRAGAGRGQEVRVSASRQGLAQRSQGVELRLPWESCRALLQDQRMLLVVWGSWEYLALPVRAFATDQDLAAFRALVLERAPVSGRDGPA